MDCLQFPNTQLGNQVSHMELYEIQKAELGRKYGCKDRRPIDPPPIVQLKLIDNQETSRRVGSDVDDFASEVNSYGFVCHVDLVPVSDRRQDSCPNPRESISHVDMSPPSSTSSSSSLFSGLGMASHALSRQYSDSPASAMPSDVPTHSSNSASRCYGCIESLAGETFVHANYLDYKGESRIAFVFSDISVRNEGDFCLRYQAFNIFRRDVYGNCPIVAECFSGPFHIYPSKDFPGLGPSTELTKYCSRLGIRVNCREGTKRKRKAKATAEAEQEQR